MEASRKKTDYPRMKILPHPSSRSPRCLPLAALLFCAAIMFTGCVSNRFKKAPKNTPPPHLLNVTFASAQLEGTLTSLITFNGPGSWKRNAFWDEYVVFLRNPGSEPLTVSSVSLVDDSGTSRPPGSNPWALEKQSKTLEQKYKETGLAFVRYTVPGVLISGTGLTIAVSSGIGIMGPASAGASLAAGATIIALPLYYLAVVSINHDNRKTMEREFHRRRLALPLTLAPGETRTGSLFFPMVPSPRSLNLNWSTGPITGESVLPLDFLKGLHLKVQATHANHADTGRLQTRQRGCAVEPAQSAETLEIVFR